VSQLVLKVILHVFENRKNRMDGGVYEILAYKINLVLEIKELVSLVTNHIINNYFFQFQSGMLLILLSNNRIHFILGKRLNSEMFLIFTNLTKNVIKY